MGDPDVSLELAFQAPAGPTDSIDSAAALARLGGNVQLLAEVATLFLEDCPRLMADLADNLRQQNAAGLQFTAHLFRGSLSALGANRASEAARELEMIARTGDLDRVAGAVGNLETALQRLKPVLSALVSQAKLPGTRDFRQERLS